MESDITPPDSFYLQITSIDAPQWNRDNMHPLTGIENSKSVTHMKANKYKIKPTVAPQERLAVQFGHAGLKAAHSQVLQSALLHLDIAFKNFFEKRAKFPRFKKKSGKQSCQYPQGVKIKDSLIFIPKVGWVKAVIHREPLGKIKAVTVSKDATGCYFAAVLLDDGAIQSEKVKHIASHIGLDMGITDFITLSTGEKSVGVIMNPQTPTKREAPFIASA